MQDGSRYTTDFLFSKPSEDSSDPSLNFLCLIECSEILKYGKGEVWVPAYMSNTAIFNMCLSQVISQQQSGCRLFLCNIFVFRLLVLFYTYIMSIVFSFALLNIYQFWFFIADYPIWALFIVADRMVPRLWFLDLLSNWQIQD